MVRPLSRRAFLAAAASTGAGLAATRNASARADPTGTLPAPDSITTTDPALLSAVEAAALLQAGKLHPRDLLESCFSRSRAFDGEIGAWVRIYPELAHTQADAAAERLSARAIGTDGSPPLVCGLPIALKDLFAVEGLPLTASSAVLDGNIAAANSTVWTQLERDGMIVMGHSHTHEFAVGVTTPQVSNPWNTQLSPGGSSGGSAALLAARFAPLATGTDTGGSIRIPASACGVSSFKPTFGLCSTDGVIPLTWTRDTAGPMARSLADASLLLSHMLDPATSRYGLPTASTQSFPISPSGSVRPLSEVRIGVPDTIFEALPEPLASLFADFLTTARRLGAETIDVSMPRLPSSLLLGDRCEMGAYHLQFADRLGKYRPSTVAAVGLATAALATPVAEYIGFERDRLRYQRDFNRMFQDHSLTVIVLPGAVTDGIERVDDVSSNVLTSPIADVRWANYAGAPVATIPVGRSSATGMPFGVQIGGVPWSDMSVMQVGLELQAAIGSWTDIPAMQSSTRDIPTATVVEPGIGPDPTNTQGASTPFSSVPTVSTDTR
ncbi:amidase [Rhodococcus sp. NPDC057297]|uniref:amidase n=1 Tax=Rhodococcus sp. NPDC057297 TaxID=3346090 RepID=UPI0036304546